MNKKQIFPIELTRTKNAVFSEIISNWKDYDTDTLVNVILEYKKRNLIQNEQFLSMISNLEIEKSKSIAELENHFLDKNNSKSYQELIQNLITNPTEEDKKEIEANRVLRERMREIENHHKKSSSRDILVGALWFIGGSIVTIISLTNGHGGIIAYGAIIFGGIQLMKGIFNSME